jgi:putative ABC transport system substrate-binding protein
VEHQVTPARDIDRALGAPDRSKVDGVFVLSQTLRTNFPSLVLRLTMERRLPLVGPRKEWVQQGALFSYAADLAAIGRVAAPYVTKILSGTKPGDLPVQEPTKFELVINLKTAKALGLTIPQTLLQRADQIIE